MIGRISAILCLDVVGYTERMNEDANRTLEELQRVLDNVVRPLTDKNAGRIFKLTGDGALMEFDTATAAINTASAILRDLRGDSVSLRAGIHVGEVTVKGADVFGEAVNIAARLQSSAQPGGGLVSKSAVEIAGTSLGVSLQPATSMRLKGIPKPVDAYSIDLDGDRRQAERTRQAASQIIRYAQSKDGTNLAWTKTGQGRQIVMAPNWLRHLSYDWTKNPLGGWLPQLSERYCLVRFDGRNNGLSDRGVQDISLDRLVEDLEAVFDAAGLDRAPVFGLSLGATVAAAFAARHPDRVSGLVLMGGFVQGLAKRNQPGIAALGKAMMELSRTGWNDEYPSGRDLMAQSFSPAASPHDQRVYAEFMKLAMDLPDWLKVGELVDNVDISELLPSIRSPTLVLHANNERMHSMDQGRKLASCIQNTRLVSLETANNTMPAYDPAWPKALAEIADFLGTV